MYQRDPTTHQSLKLKWGRTQGMMEANLDQVAVSRFLKMGLLFQKEIQANSRSRQNNQYSHLLKYRSLCKHNAVHLLKVPIHESSLRHSGGRTGRLVVCRFGARNLSFLFISYVMVLHISLITFLFFFFPHDNLLGLF